MIKRLKIKFIVLAMTSLTVLLAVIVAGMNVINYSSVVSDADSTLSLLSKNKGTFSGIEKGKGNPLPHGMSKELPYESRYFSVILDEGGEIVGTESSKIVSVDASSAAEYAEKVMNSEAVKGFVGNFRYVRYREADGERIIFLDCGRKLDSFYTFLYASVGMSVAGLLVIFFVIFFVAGKILRPVTESYEKQKQFITDAGHELKTPLTIINANVDILEMEIGENDSLCDIAQQTKRLRSLTDNLVTLARMEEGESTIQKIEFPVSEVVTSAATPFRALALAQNKTFECNIQPWLTLYGNDKAIEQLVCILMDNALKYSPDGGDIALSMIKQNKAICLSVSNSTADPIDSESLDHVFERFYRTDASRNSESGGHGIGLSVAKAIVTSHGGKIQATCDGEYSFKVTATLPA